jgi:purine-binding chemotaxis protein CheW
VALAKTIQLLTFTLAGEVYALDVTVAREVVEFTHVTPIPKTPEWIRGVLNLRGAVVPVLDLKLKLGMEATARTKTTCILILEIDLDGEQTVVGVLADAVREVIEVEQSDIEPPPRFGARVSIKYVRGMGRHNNALFVLLDVSKVFASADFELAQQMADASPVDPSNALSDNEPNARAEMVEQPYPQLPHA